MKWNLGNTKTTPSTLPPPPKKNNILENSEKLILGGFVSDGSVRLYALVDGLVLKLEHYYIGK